MKKNKPLNIDHWYHTVKNYKRIYSGKHRSGICVCGHSYEDHHNSMVMNQEYYRQTKEVYVPEECLFYGCNEEGGLDDDGNTHCFGYKDNKA